MTTEEALVAFLNEVWESYTEARKVRGLDEYLTFPFGKPPSVLRNLLDNTVEASQTCGTFVAAETAITGLVSEAEKKGWLKRLAQFILSQHALQNEKDFAQEVKTFVGETVLALKTGRVPIRVWATVGRIPADNGLSPTVDEIRVKLHDGVCVLKTVRGIDVKYDDFRWGDLGMSKVEGGQGRVIMEVYISLKMKDDLCADGLIEAGRRAGHLMRCFAAALVLSGRERLRIENMFIDPTVYSDKYHWRWPAGGPIFDNWGDAEERPFTSDMKMNVERLLPLLWGCQHADINKAVSRLFKSYEDDDLDDKNLYLVIALEKLLTENSLDTEGQITSRLKVLLSSNVRDWSGMFPVGSDGQTSIRKAIQARHGVVHFQNSQKANLDLVTEIRGYVQRAIVACVSLASNHDDRIKQLISLNQTKPKPSGDYWREDGYGWIDNGGITNQNTV